MLRAFIFIAPFLLSGQVFAQQEPSTQEPEVAAPDNQDDLTWAKNIKARLDRGCDMQDADLLQKTPVKTLDEIAKRLQVSPDALTKEMGIQGSYDQFTSRFEPIQKNSADLKVGREALAELHRLNNESVDQASGTHRIENDDPDVYIFAQQKDGVGITTTCLIIGKNRALARAQMANLWIEEMKPPEKHARRCLMPYDSEKLSLLDLDFAYKTKNIKQDRHVYACQTVQAGS